MKNNIVILIAMLLASSVIARDCDVARIIARENLNSYMESVKRDNPESLESGSTWRIGTVAFDLDGDGEKEILYSDFCSQDRMGWAWGVAEIDKDNHVNYIEFAEHEPCYYRPDHMYILELRGQRKMLIADNDILEIENGVFRVRPYGKNLKDIVGQEDFISLSPVNVESFSGVELKHTCASYITTELKKKANLDFDAEYIIYLDANNDGFEDAYVSAEADKVTSDKYRWRLYLNDGEKMIPAAESVRLRGDVHAPPEILDPEEIARKDSFYQVTYMFGKPAVRIMDYEKGFLLCHSYEKLLTRNEKRARPTRNLDEKGYNWGDVCEWEAAVQDRLGHFIPLDFEDFIIKSFFVKLERISCKESNVK